MELENNSGLLMKIVRSLNTNGSKNDRDDEKVRLEKDFKECDSRLDNMISDHLTDFTTTIQAFSQLSSRITSSQEKVRAVKENLVLCKNLLHCKRDELKRLWVEGIKHKTAAVLMDEVENIKGVNEKVKRALDAKDYVEASSLIMAALSILDGDLSSVKGLAEIRNDLSRRKEELVGQILNELHHTIYIRSTSTIVRNFQRQGSQARNRPDLKSTTSLEQSSEADEEKITRLILEANIENLSRFPPPTSPPSDPVVFISSLITALATLRRLGEGSELLRQQISPAINTIITTASQQVAETSSAFDDELHNLQQPQLLLDLLELIFAQLRVVSSAHQIIIANLIHIKTQPHSHFKLYSIIDLWSRVQPILQSFLANYLEVDESSNDSLNQSATSNVNLTSFFAKKRLVTRGKKSSALFKFNQAEQVTPSTGGSEKASRVRLVTKPSHDNISHIYGCLHSFLNYISMATRLPPTSLSLHAYVSSFVQDTYLLRLQHCMDDILAHTHKSHDLKRSLTNAHTQHAYKLPRPLFQSTVSVATFLDQVCQLTTHLPDHSSSLLNLLCKSLQDYLSHLQQLHTRLSQGDLEEHSLISAAWIKDPDINRFLQSLPTWMDLKRFEDISLSSPSSSSSPSSCLISEVDRRGMLAKESSVISSNIGDSGVGVNDILTDHAVLKHLGHLCESALWFSERIDELCANLESGNTCPKFLLSTPVKPRPPANQGVSMATNRKSIVSKDTLTTLKALARHFEDLSDSCLLLLHLEVRMHCLHHLLRLPEGDFFCAIDRLEPDDHVTRLCKDLSHVEAALVHSLQENRFRYIFQGLGHLIATTLTTAAGSIKRINDTGVKKMCRNVATIQQCLTSFLDVREPDLEHAKHFYEMLCLSPDEVMKVCLEGGSIFSEGEYVLLLQLNHRSNPEVSSSDDLKRRLEKLASILATSASAASTCA